MLVPAESQLRGKQILECCEPEVRESRSLERGEPLAGDVREHVAAPETERCAQACCRLLGVSVGESGPAVCRESLEAARVDRLRRCLEGVARRARDEDCRAGAERLAKRRDVDVQGARRRRGIRIRPQLVDDSIAWHDFVRVNEKQAEQGPLPPAPERERSALAPHDERTQHLELQPDPSSL